MSLSRAVIAALFLLAATTTAALAHAGLISTDPADGAVVGAEPPGLSMVFTEPVSPIGFSVVGLKDAPIPLTADKQDGPNVHIPLPPGLASGSYLFSWRVTSEDGHPVNGTVAFAIGAPSGTITANAPDPVLALAIWTIRALQYAALFLGVGSAAFGALQELPPATRRVSRWLAGLGLVLVPPALALQGLDLLGLPIGAVATAEPWLAAGGSSYAPTEALLAAAFVLALLPGRVPAIAAGLAGALAPMLSGHASTAEPQALMRLAVFVHMASLVFWLGALLPLFALLRGADTNALRRFSRRIPWAIGTLLLSGAVLAIVQLGPPDAAWLGPYGLLLAGKLVLVAGLLLVALWNRVRLTAPALAGEPRALRLGIGVELVLVAMILGVVAGWRFTPPPRVLAEIEAASAPVTVALTAPGGSAGLVVTPGHPGPVSLEVTLPAPADAVTVTLENPGADIATIGRKATPAAAGTWRVDGLVLPVGGDWLVGVAARTGKFDMTIYSGTLSLPGKDTQMNPAIKAAVAASSMLLAAPAAAAGLLQACPTGQSFTHGDITVAGAFSRATPAGAQSAGAYLTISNAGAAADTLLSASSPAAQDVSLHQMAMNGNVMEMSAVEGGLPVPAGGSVSLDPMGYHLMLTGLAAPFVQGGCLEMTLHFAHAGDITVELNIGGFAQRTPPEAGPSAGGAAPSMEMSSMGSM